MSIDTIEIRASRPTSIVRTRKSMRYVGGILHACLISLLSNRQIIDMLEATTTATSTEIVQELERLAKGYERRNNSLWSNWIRTIISDILKSI